MSGEQADQAYGVLRGTPSAAGPDLVADTLIEPGVPPGSAPVRQFCARERTAWQPPMEFDPAALRHLADLAAALDEPDLDLAAGLADLDARLRSVVSSYIGLSVLVPGPDRPVTLTVVEHGTVGAGSSLTLSPATGRVSLVVYAATPGAFVDLAADVSWLMGPDAVAVVLDEHLTVLPASPRCDLSAGSSVQQAIGVLIGRGHRPAEAERLLTAEAARRGTDLVGAAEALLATIGPQRADDPVVDESGAA